MIGGMIVTVICEESFQIDAPRTVVPLGKSDGTEQSLIRHLTRIHRVMNAAEIYEIQRTSAHDEHGLKVACLSCLLVLGLRSVTDLCKVIDDAALIGELELADSNQLVLYCGGICQQIGVVLYVATCAKLFLLSLGLNRKYL